MILTEEQEEDLFGRTRNGLIATKYRWPNKTVPYELSSNHTQEQRNYIEKALKTMESVSCLKFVRRTNEEDYVEMQVSSNIQLIYFDSFFTSMYSRLKMADVIHRLDVVVVNRC